MFNHCFVSGQKLFVGGRIVQRLGIWVDRGWTWLCSPQTFVCLYLPVKPCGDQFLIGWIILQMHNILVQILYYIND